MKKSLKRIGTFFIAFVLVLMCTAIAAPEAQAATVVDSGTMPGTSLSWSLTKDGTLVLSGSSVSGDYGTAYPWEGYKDLIREIVLGEGVTSVGYQAFYEYGELETLTMSDSVTNIGNMAFYLCQKLKNITFSQNLQTIETTAFCNCAMSDVVIPDSVTTIGNYAFANNGNLKTFKFPKNLTTIEYYMFWGCNNLQTVTMGDKVTTIQQYSIDGPVKNMNLSKSLSSVEIGALTSTQLESIVIPGTLTSVAYDSFGTGQYAENIKISEGVKVLKGFPSYNKKITEYTIPSTVINIGETTFNGCTTADLIVFTGDAPLFHSNTFAEVKADVAYPKDMADWTEDVRVDYKGDLTWRPYGKPIFTKQPERYYGRVGSTVTFEVATDIDAGWPVYQWQYSSDYGDTWQNYTGAGHDTAKISFTLTNDNVETMYRCLVTDDFTGASIMSDETQTRTPIYASGVTITDITAPYDCVRLDWELTMNGTIFVREAEKDAEHTSSWRDYTNDITRVVYEQGISIAEGGFIEDGGFKECESLREVYLPNTMTEIGDLEFYSCGKLKYVDFPNKLQKIGMGAFGGCALTSLDLPDTVHALSTGVFSNNYRVEEIKLPESLTYIPHSAFSNQENLKKITFGSNVKSIDSHAFIGCRNLTTVEFPEGLETIGEEAFMSCTALTDINLPDTVTSLDPTAFNGTTALENIRLSGGLTVLNGFPSNNKISEIVIPASILRISAGTFNNCADLKTVVFEGDAPYIHDDTFAGVTATAYYPMGNPTWTKEVMLNYSGNLTWKPACADAHKWMSATCTAPKTCSVCGMTEGAALGHKWTDATCTTPKTCSTCKVTEGSALGHKWTAATCTTPKICSTCRVTEGAALGHKWTAATCTTPKTCSACKTTEGAALGHKWTAATCTTPKTCSACKTTEGSALGHKWTDATCTTPKTCSTCKITEGSALGHKWTAATCTTPKTCSTCKTTEGAALGHDLEEHVAQAPSCTEKGWNAYETCSRCDYTTYEEIPALGHDLEEHAAEAPTCTEIGWAAYEACTRCAYTTYEELPELGHEVEDGECERCGYELLKITKQPKSVFVELEEDAKFTVKAEGDDLTYQWYYKSPEGKKFKKCSGTKSTYKLEMTEDRSGRMLYCVVTDGDGNSVQSETVTMRLAATITGEPKTSYKEIGEKAKFTVKAVGEGLTYQWYYKSADSSKYKKADCTKATYTITTTEDRRDREFYCVVTDKYGNSVQSETVTMRLAATITGEPKTSYKEIGEKAKFTVKAVGEGLTYQWYYKSAGSSKYKKADCTKATYTITMTEDRKDRKFYCIITDKYGNEVKTKTVTMKMSVSIKTEPKSVTVKSGSKAKVTVKAIGDDLTYTWYYKDPGSSKYKKASTKSATYSATMKSSVSGRKVYCIVEDEYGNTVKSKTVTLKKK